MISILRNNLLKLFGSNALIKPVWFIYMYSVISKLGSEDFGSFTIFLAIITIVTQLLDAGLVNKTYVLLNDSKFSELFGTNNLEQLLIQIKVIIAILFSILTIITSILFFSNYIFIIFFGVLIFISIYLTQQYRVIFRSHEFFTIESICVVLERVLVILLTIDIFFNPYGFDKYINRYAVGYIVFLIFAIFIFERKIGHQFTFFKLNDYLLVLNQAGSLYVNNIILSIRQRLPYFILEYIGTRSIVGIYSSAYRFVESYMFLPNSVVQVNYAQFSKKASLATDIVKDVWKTHLLIFVPTLIICTSSIILMPFIITLLLGDEFLAYINEYSLAILIFLPNGSYYLLTSLSNIYYIQHKVNYLYILNFSTLVITQFLFFYLFGIIGSIISMLLSEYIMIFEYHYALKNKTNLRKSFTLDVFSFIISVTFVTYTLI